MNSSLECLIYYLCRLLHIESPMGGFVIVLIFLMIVLALFAAVCVAACRFFATSNNQASLIATQLNQEAERRHQETVAALQDIAKAIRECNEG